MKIRTDFVTNSSSSAFVLTLAIKPKNGNTIEYELECSEGGMSERESIDVTIKAESLKKAKTIDQLIAILQKGIVEPFAEEGSEPVLSDGHPFIQEIKKRLNTVNDIDYIVIKGEETAGYVNDEEQVYIIDTSYSFKTKKGKSRLKGNQLSVMVLVEDSS